MAFARTLSRALQKSALFIFVSYISLFYTDSAFAARTEQVRVARAIDGDSLLLADGRQVRLIGINTPEFDKPPTPPQPLAVEARDFLNTLVRSQSVLLQYGSEPKDRHGRVLAYASLLDGRDLQLLMVQQGFAWFVAIPPNIERLAEYRAAELTARHARRGIWNQAMYDPVPAARVSREHAGFLRLTGTVSAVKPKRSGTELMLANGVWIYVPATTDLSGASLRHLLGKRIVARGWLSAYNGGLRLRLTHSTMLEVML